MCVAAAESAGGPSADEIALFHQTLAERLHDGPLQELVALQLKAANLARLSAASAADQLERLLELGNLAQKAIEHLNDLIRELTADPASPAELFPRLIELCEEFRSTTGVDCDVRLDRVHLRFGPGLADVVYRTVRELLANVRKHAQASEVTVTSRFRQDGSVAVSIADDGIGMQVSSRRGNPFEGGGFGLWSIEHRLGEFGAHLEIESHDGLRATVVLPRRLLLPA
ncbi:MAG TPA: ATP-binding protein [Gammaproteobacteria bacterium]|nr:ATP-binding protein [Gammaproteobacteria bacterium]